MNNDRILVSIASYRDTQLIATVEDLVFKCSDSSKLDVHILMQYGNELTPFEFIQKTNRLNANIQVHAVPYENSQGVCWARALLQSHYSDQKYFFQLDSHHRFVDMWDLECIEMIERLKKMGYSKPVLTAYLPSFNPYSDPDGRVNEPWKLNFDRFIPEGTIFTIPSAMDNHKKRKIPMLSRFYSAHFMFSDGAVCEECPYDPNLWFHGEEQSMAVRLWTHGYDLFNPQKIIAWHEYSRNYRGNKKVWDDLNDWPERNKKSHQRFRQLFYMEPRTIDFKEFDFGKERSLRDYEKFAGIHFKKRAVQAETLMGKEPPNLFNYKNWKDWEKSFICIRRHCLDLWYKELPENLDELDFVAVIYEYEGEQLFREDIKGIKLKSIYKERSDNKEDFYKFWSEFQNDLIPSNAVIWPYLKDKGWGKKLDFNLRT